MKQIITIISTLLLLGSPVFGQQTVNTPPPCPSAIPVSINGITTTNAVVSWSLTPNESYKLSYRIVGSNATWQSVSRPPAPSVMGTVAMQMLSGLTPNAIYECELHSTCSLTKPLQGMQNQFKTIPCSSTKTIKAVFSNLASTSIRVQTQLVGGENYIFQYRIKSHTGWTMLNKTSTPLGQLVFDLTNLLPDVTYECALRPVCSVFYEGLQEFTTKGAVLCLPRETPLNVQSGTTTVLITTGNLLDFEVQYRPKGSTVPWLIHVFTPNPAREIKGLTPKTVYEYQYRVKCSASTYSPYTQIWTFSTI
jgi:hypothetical protein